MAPTDITGDEVYIFAADSRYPWSDKTISLTLDTETLAIARTALGEDTDPLTSGLAAKLGHSLSVSHREAEYLRSVVESTSDGYGLSGQIVRKLTEAGIAPLTDPEC